MIESSKGRKTRSQLKDTTHEDEPKPRSLKTVPPTKTKRFDGVHIPVDRNHPNFKNVANQSKSAPEPSNSKDLNGKSNRSNHSSGDTSLGKSRSVSVEEKSDKEDSDSEVELVEETSETTRKVRFREPSPSRSDETHRPFDHVPPREVSPIPRNQPKSKPEKVTESKGSSKGPKFRLRNELFIPGLEEELADRISRQMITLTAAEAFQLSGKVRQIMMRKMKNRQVRPQERIKSFVNEAHDVEPSVEEIPRTGMEMQQFIAVEDLSLSEGLIFEKILEDRDGMKAGDYVQLDPVVAFLHDVDENDSRRDMTIVATMGNGLRSVWPVVNNRDDLDIESVLDSGSQIVAIDMCVALGLGLGWDPKVTIQMQNVHGGLARTKGLSRNVPFRFGPITLYLQCHVQEKAPFEILLGRPFDVLTESVIHTFGSGDQELTITDPNTGKQYTIGTSPRGQSPKAQKRQLDKQKYAQTRTETPDPNQETSPEEEEKTAEPNF